MKQTIKTCFAALVLLLAISCKKENSSMQTLSIDGTSSTQNVITDNKILAGKTIKIGTQVWITRNLDVSRYRNGDPIPQVTDEAAWAALTTGAWCWYNNDSDTYAKTCGRLYNWYAVNDPRGLAPTGWHIPSDAEWDTLITFLHGYASAGGRLKSTGTIEAGTGFWHYPNKGANNKSGFTGYPGGYRYPGTFNAIGYLGFWWSSTELIGSTGAYYRLINSSDGHISIGVYEKFYGFSVRCVKD